MTKLADKQQIHNTGNMLPSNLPTRILIVEDDEDDFLIIEACIKDIPEKAFRIDWCYDYNEALQRISKASYDIYFVDYLLGEKTGLELLQEAINMGCEEPLVLLTGIGNRQVDIQAMTIGAVDFPGEKRDQYGKAGALYPLCVGTERLYQGVADE